MRTAKTEVLEIAYEEHGDPAGPPAVLLHGFPYDARAFDGVVSGLRGCRVIVPYLRGFGGTRFLHASTPRSGQQAALGADVIDLMDALGIDQAVLAGFDWGGRAACVAAALHPERVTGLVLGGGYSIHRVESADEPLRPEAERAIWHYFYFLTERGARGLRTNLDELCLLLWRTWSPEWAEAESAFAASAPSLRNPDFVDVALHSYRHRFGVVPGDPRYDEDERRLAALPPITVPSVVLQPLAHGFPGVQGNSEYGFAGAVRTVPLPGIGHNISQEAPVAFAEAVRSLTSSLQ